MDGPAPCEERRRGRAREASSPAVHYLDSHLDIADGGVCPP